jgi:single-strand DNA-binding protein
MINKFTGMGYLSSDANFQEFQSGKKKISFSIGITISKETLWIEVEAWDKIAQNCNKYLKKGSLVLVDGKLKFNSWKNKNGLNQSKITVVSEFIKVINSKSQDSTIRVKEVESFSSEESEAEEDIELQKDLEEIPF